LEGLPYDDLDDLKKKNDLHTQKSESLKRISIGLDELVKKYEFIFRDASVHSDERPNGRPDGRPDGRPNGRPDGRPDGRSDGRPDRRPDRSRSPRGHKPPSLENKGRDLEPKITTIYDDDDVRVILKPMNYPMRKLYQYVTQCIQSKDLPPDSVFIKHINDQSSNSETCAVIAKTNQFRKIMNSRDDWDTGESRQAKSDKEFYLVTEYKDMQGEVINLSGSETKQKLTVTNAGNLTHKDAPGKHFLLLSVKGGERSSLYNECAMYKTLKEHRYNFTENVTGVPIILCCHFVLQTKKDEKGYYVTKCSLTRGKEEIDERLTELGFTAG